MTPKPPPPRAFWPSRLRYRYDWLRETWLWFTGRCPGCLQRHGNHKLGCSRQPGRGLRFSLHYDKDNS